MSIKLSNTCLDQSVLADELDISRFGNKLVYLLNVRVISVKTLKDHIDEFHQAEQVVLSWYEEAVT